jgi:hypothetical protein
VDNKDTPPQIVAALAFKVLPEMCHNRDTISKLLAYISQERKRLAKRDRSDIALILMNLNSDNDRCERGESIDWTIVAGDPMFEYASPI